MILLHTAWANQFVGEYTQVGSLYLSINEDQITQFYSKLKHHHFFWYDIQQLQCFHRLQMFIFGWIPDDFDWWNILTRINTEATSAKSMISQTIGRENKGLHSLTLRSGSLIMWNKYLLLLIASERTTHLGNFAVFST